MAKKAKGAGPKKVEALRHSDERRVNIPTAEHQSVLEAERVARKEVRYPRNTDLDPQLVWRGKDYQDWSDLVVQAPPLYNQENAHPKAILASASSSSRFLDAGIQPHEIGVFVRSEGEVPRATAAASVAGVPSRVLDERVDVKAGEVNIGTMHLAKGLELGAVAVMACDDEVLPSQERIAAVGDEGDLRRSTTPNGSSCT